MFFFQFCCKDKQKIDYCKNIENVYVVFLAKMQKKNENLVSFP